jgi:NDP-sugar pyrophosphorylase family protein
MADLTPKAMILAAGFGTRLGQLTQLRPKPMMPLCGAPLVRWSALWLAAQGVKDVVINLHHLGEQIEADLGDGSELGLNISYTHEEGMILGTGGGLRNARHLLDDGSGAPILVLNGKILFELELDALMKTHRELGCEATMVMREDAEGVWGGKLAAGPDGKLATFLGETREGVQPGTPLMFTGIHVFEPSFLDRVPAEGEQCIVRTAYKELFFEGGGPAVHVTDGYWWEHSTPERYLAGMRAVLEGKVGLPHAQYDPRGVHASASVAEGAELIEPVFVGPNAVIEAGAKVGPFAAIGEGAHVAASARVREAIVWPGAKCEGEWTESVCTGA